MKRFGIALLAALGLTSLAPAADLPAAKSPDQPKPTPNCWGSAWDILNTSASDCPLTFAGITLYGTLDVGAGYNTAGVPFGASYEKGVFYEMKKPSQGGRWSWFPNAQSTSVVGVKLEEQLYQDWLLIGAVELGYNPYSLMLINGPRSLADNNLNSAAFQTPMAIRAARDNGTTRKALSASATRPMAR